MLKMIQWLGVMAGVFLGLPALAALAETRLIAAESSPANAPTTLGLRRFAELVKERSNGDIIIEVKFGGVLGKDEKALSEQVQLGTLDMGRFSLVTLARFVPALETLQLPYLWKSQASLWKVLRGATGQRLLGEAEAAKFYGLCYYETGARSFYNAKHEIKTVADLKDLLIRVPRGELMVDFVALLGAQPVPMAFSEVYDGMKQGVIDGAESTWSTYEAAGHYEIARYYTFDCHTRSPEILVASKIAFDKKLKPEQIALIKQAARDSEETEIQQWNEREEASSRIVRGKGNIFTELTPPAQEEFLNAIRPLYDKYGALHKTLIQEIRAQQ